MAIAGETKSISGRQYKAIITEACGPVRSSTELLTVGQTTVGGTLSAGTTACGGKNGGTIMLTGQVGSVTMWQQSINGGTSFTNITNTTTSLTYSNLTSTTIYRAVVQSGGCAAQNSSTST